MERWEAENVFIRQFFFRSLIGMIRSLEETNKQNKQIKLATHSASHGYCKGIMPSNIACQIINLRELHDDGNLANIG